MTDNPKTSWTLHQLQQSLIDELRDPSLTTTERLNIEAVCGKEIRLKAIEIAKNRKLNQREYSIAEKHGYRRAA